MGRHGFVFGLAVLLFSALNALALPQPQPQQLPHMDLEMTGSEYAKLLPYALQAFDGRQTSLQPILDAGKRNLDWLKFINDHRDAQHKISLSSAATEVGYPIEQPRIYNPDIITNDYNALMKTVPASIKSVVEGVSTMSENPPVDDATYMNWALKIDRSYQMAARWTLMEPYLSQMQARKTMDVRGYYFLSKTPDIKSKLQHWSSNSQNDQAAYKEYLVELCLNNEHRSCESELKTAISQNKVYDFYARYNDGAKQLWDNFFKVIQARPDVTWKNSPEEMHVPFREPTNSAIKDFLATNIQDEWKWNGWRLIMDFKTDDASSMPEVTFEAGATPHVNGIAGNTITMDENAPLTEYDVQWTIRHEYGHVLGFPDCYVEFYDAGKSVMISYQLDITNLMCSRRGHLKELHYTELKRTYGSSVRP